jgi:hypothetical protein
MYVDVSVVRIMISISQYVCYAVSSKVMKLLGLHAVGLYGAYLLMTSNVHLYTKLLCFFQYHACGMFINAVEGGGGGGGEDSRKRKMRRRRRKEEKNPHS